MAATTLQETKEKVVAPEGRWKEVTAKRMATTKKSTRRKTSLAALIR
jgi:hypothetical protein